MINITMFITTFILRCTDLIYVINNSWAGRISVCITSSLSFSITFSGVTVVNMHISELIWALFPNRVSYPEGCEIFFPPLWGSTVSYINKQQLFIDYLIANCLSKKHLILGLKKDRVEGKNWVQGSLVTTYLL